MTDLQTKLTEFKTAIEDITTALRNKNVTIDGGGLLSLNKVAEKINSVVTHQNMGTKTVEIKQNAIVYGVKIIENEPDPEHRVEYIDDAKGMVPVSSYGNNYGTWKPTWIFDKIFPVMLKTNGVIDYLLDPDNQTLKKDGGSSDISNTNYDGNAMVNFDKFYLSFGMDGEDEVIRICNVQTTISGTASFDPIGFYKNNKTSVADKIFLPMFVGSLDSKSRLRSISEEQIENVEKYTIAVTYAEKNGSGYGIESYAMNQMLGALYLILMKNCNVKTTLGNGRSLYESGIIVKTGYQVTKGAISSGKFLWIEDFINGLDIDHYATPFYRIESGFNMNLSLAYIKMYPPYLKPGLTSGYDNVRDYKFSTRGNIKQMKCSNSFGRIPINYTDNYNTDYEASISTYSTSENSSSARGGQNAVFGRSIGPYENGFNDNVCAALTYIP